ncbi:MAG: NCS2 family permease [Pseudomonadota bacterium]
MLERLFAISANGSSVRTEVMAGTTTFLTMAYIVFINPAILGAAGMDKGAVFVATCLIAALGTALMGLYANYPIAVAPGMGLNAYFAFAVVLQMGYSWQAALGAVFVSGCCFLLVTLTGARAAIIEGIPDSLKTAIPTGIGLFLAIISLKNAGLIVASEATLVTVGDIQDPKVILACLGFLLVVALSVRRVKGALLLSILAITAASFLVAGNTFQGVVSLPPSLAPTFFQLDISGALSHGFLNVVLVFFLVEVFDASGTLMGVARKAGLLVPERARQLKRALLVDSASVFVGSLLGTSSATAYLESASGVQEGGRTGLTAVVVAVLFLACLFFAPLAASVPAYATAPALFFVACLMLSDLADIAWDDPTEVAPACVTAVMMPFTYSIANGIAFGFLAYAAIKLLTGRYREVKTVTWIIAAVFLFKFIYEGTAG